MSQNYEQSIQQKPMKQSYRNNRNEMGLDLMGNEGLDLFQINRQMNLN